MTGILNYLDFLRLSCIETGRLADETGRDRWDLLRQYLRMYRQSHTSIKELRLFRLYEYPRAVQKDFLSMERCVAISNMLIGGASEEELSLIADKAKFNRYFHDFIHRDWLYLPDATRADLIAFFGRNEQFMAKELVNTQGKGVWKFTSADVDPDLFLAEHKDMPMLLEEVIRQHPDMSKLNPSSVNTIRIITAHYKGRTLIVGGALRCGGKDAVVDNFSNGGIAYPLDMETGVVCAPGWDHEGQRYERHPTTGIDLMGFRVPYWDDIIRQTTAAAEMLPRVGYIGWDIAVTQDGPDFVEGNIDVPGPTLIQLDKPDAYGRITRFLKDCDREH